MTSLDKCLDIITTFQSNEKGHANIIYDMQQQILDLNRQLEKQTAKNHVREVELSSVKHDNMLFRSETRKLRCQNKRIKKYRNTPKIKLNNDTFYCTMCLEEGGKTTDSNIHLKCGHSYHFDCFMNYLSKSQNIAQCIMCRAKYNMPPLLKTIHTLRATQAENETTIELQSDEINELDDICMKLRMRSVYTHNTPKPNLTPSIQRRLDVYGIDIKVAPIEFMFEPLFMDGDDIDTMTVSFDSDDDSTTVVVD